MLHEWYEISNFDGEIPLQNFWSGVKVWIERPHIVNKRLIGMEVLYHVEIRSDECYESTLIDALLLKGFSVTKVTEINKYLRQLKPLIYVDLPAEGRVPEPRVSRTFELRRLFPRSTQADSALEVVIIDYEQQSAIILPVELSTSVSKISPAVPYKISWENCRVNICVPETCMTEEQNLKSIDWLSSQAFPKILKWCKNVPKNSIAPSLSKVPMEMYCRNYNTLKDKYGKSLVEKWPEKTDPSKFVYEDIAIASYLLALWEEERKLLGCAKKQSFVDLGCGNGLLVFLLSSEGHPGIGIDIRKRNIWNFYGPETKLVEKEIIPSTSGLFPEYDWIIGNHSDELTPWIPVIASRSSYDMRVFLLPCCAYTFDGKYDRGDASSSKYQSYLNFIEELCTVMGFTVHRDKLRIPSTKRVCFICSSRNYKQDYESDHDKIRTEFIKKHTKQDFKNTNNQCDNQNVDLNNELPGGVQNGWSASFKPRDKVEPVRNCCSLDPKFIDSTVVKILELLLNCGEAYIEVDSEKRLWKCGGTMSIKTLAEVLGPDILLKLKNQCGGLQTLLKNHRNIFSVEQGCVSLQSPAKKVQRFAKKSKKTLNSFSNKPCVFFFHHPDGCPFSNQCTFAHLKAD